MNKTVTINISGVIFHIEEDAYEKLSGYIHAIRSRFSADEGRDEIIADIESRIAEILQGRTGPSKQVVLMKDVDHVIELMGAPEHFSDGESNNDHAQENQEQEQTNNARNPRRKLYRDQDEKIIGGVCSGLGYYFDIDVVWIRLAFVLIFFAFGTGIFFYLLLLIIIPEAETTAEKLEMRGEPVDVNNISKTIKEEFEGFKNRMKGFGEEAGAAGQRMKQNARNAYRSGRRRGFDDFFSGITHILGRIFGYLLVFLGLFFLIGLFTSAFSITDFGPELVYQNVRSFFPTGGSYFMLMAGILLFFGIPFLMMIYKGLQIMFNIRRNDRWVNITALSLWLLGTVFGVISIVQIINGFSEKASYTEQIPLKPAGDTLYLNVNIDREMLNEDFEEKWNRKYRYARRYKMVRMDEERLKFGYAELNIERSESGQTELYVYKSARGADRKEAIARAENISYQIVQKDSLITFPSYFTIGDGVAWRNQDVQIELRIPENTVIYLDPSMEEILYDVRNISNTLDEDMVDRRWIMTKKGLKCIDCAGLGIRKDGSPEELPAPPPPPAAPDSGHVK